MAISGDYGDVRPEYFRPPRSDAASQEFGVPLHEIHPASEMNDHNLLRKMLEDVEPGWEGHVLAGNCEYAEGEGDPDKINAANRLYALWERQGTESREDLSCDTEHAESEGETEKTHAGRTMLGAGIDCCWERTACRLVALLEETMAKRELMAHLYLNTLAPQPPEGAGQPRASRGHPPQLDGAKQNQLDGEKLVAKSQGGRRLGAGRPIEHIELPNGWEVRYKIRNTGLGKGKRDRQFVSPAGTFLRSKRELMAHLYLNTLAPQPPHDY